MGRDGYTIGDKNESEKREFYLKKKDQQKLQSKRMASASGFVEIVKIRSK